MERKQGEATDPGQKLIWIATIEHLRTWWASDALFLNNLVSHENCVEKLDPTTVRKIAKTYYVSRGIRRGKEARLAEYINNDLADWPATLPCRAAFVERIAEKAKIDNITKGVQLSAISKLMWFTRPTGWTMYDKFACAGLRRIDGPINDFQGFYSKLSDLGFDNAMEACRNVIRKSVFPYLWPERILDKFLMYLGQEREGSFLINADDQHRLLKLWSQFHGDGIPSNVATLVTSLSKAVAGCGLFKIGAPTESGS